MPSLPEVITVEPSASARVETVSYPPDPDPPPEYNRAMRALLAARVTIEVMLDAEHVPPSDKRPWAAIQQQFSDDLDASPASKHEKQRLVDAWLFEDFETRQALQQQSARSRPTRSPDGAHNALGAAPGLARPPYCCTGTCCKRDISPAWLKVEANDLTDMTYLACAGA